MQFEDGLKEYKKKQSYSKIQTGDETLDKLIGGGFDREIIYLLTGDKKLTTNVLWKTSVNSQIILNKGKKEKDKNTTIAYIDGFNRFNPYTISKYSLTRRLNPRNVLEHILISRAFTWEQMVEVLENKVSDLEQKIDVLIITGLTNFWSYEEKFYEELWDAIQGIKKIRTISRKEVNHYNISGKLISSSRRKRLMRNIRSSNTHT